MNHYYQPPLKKGKHRICAYPRLLPSIEAEVRRIAREYSVSRSWVISVVLADAFGISEQPQFYKTTTKIRRIK
jgi:hypothetical protein